ncbi:MAG TPA: glycoside hydrolase family 3 C-terminal domain-containing protein [Bacteroidales bacterium]|nr:glycoside hydrolase family 3 C-terminal domain-containing protein [Bacteroidales bacterium]
MKGSFPEGFTVPVKTSATFLPTGSALAATWNPELANKFGMVLGEEAHTRNKDIILAPAVNITRTPINGRTFEYMSEDPLLNSRLSVEYIKGVQSTGVVACVKHYAANNQETNRGTVNVEMDERTLQEIYLPAFKASVMEAQAFSVMTAYNKFRGVYCAENEYLVNNILRKQWGFDGIVVSDWGGTHSTVNSALYGIDVEMGSGRQPFFAKPLIDSVKSGAVPMEVIDKKVRSVLKVLFFAMHRDKAPKNTELSTPEHNRAAYDIAAQSIVLLKNQKNMLPLQVSKIKNIAIIGDNATQKQASGGFGAGVKARYEVTPLDGLKAKLGNAVNIRYARGYKPEYSKASNHSYGKVPTYEVNDSLLKEAVEVARTADVVLFFAGTNREVETEATDRSTLMLPFGQDQLLKALSAVNSRIVVVVVAAAPVDLGTCNQVAPAIVWSWFNGSQGGKALADVLTGTVNPSGKLPFTITVKLDDSPAHALKTFPGENMQTNYKEGILVGYRWFDTKQIEPQYRFGFGLSYTTFAFNSIQTDKAQYKTTEDISITIKLKNTGKLAGYETAQLYVSDLNGNVPKANKELKAFQKVYLNAGEEKTVALKVKASELAYFDEKTMSWVVNPGKYRLMAGASSRDQFVSKDIQIIKN